MPALAALLFAAATPAAADLGAVDAATRGVFAPYRDAASSDAPWERDIWSEEVAQLITRWQSVVPEGEVDDLNGGDWLCQCQDWDAQKFRVAIKDRKIVGPGVAEIEVDIDLGFGARRDAFLTFRREGGEWRLDELYSEAFPDGIKEALRQTTIADEAMQRP